MWARTAGISLGCNPLCMAEGAQGLQPWAYSSVGAQVRPPGRLHPVRTPPLGHGQIPLILHAPLLEPPRLSEPRVADPGHPRPYRGGYTPVRSRRSSPTTINITIQPHLLKHLPLACAVVRDARDAGDGRKDVAGFDDSNDIDAQDAVMIGKAPPALLAATTAWAATWSC